ncbi:MAG: hypothetical protein ABIN37_11035 [Burkholderiaceae bacterium]
MYIRKTFVAIGATGLVLAAAAAMAQNSVTATQPSNVDAGSAGSSTRAAGLAATYGASIGTPQESGTLIAGMRTGQDVTLGDVTVSGTGKNTGWGNIDIAMALAKSQVTTGATSKEFLTALDKVMDMRASGMGWGQIANGLGVNLGKAVSAAKSNKAPGATLASASTRASGSKALDRSAADGAAGKGGGNGGNKGGGSNGNGGGGGGGNGGGNGGGKGG